MVCPTQRLRRSGLDFGRQDVESFEGNEPAPARVGQLQLAQKHFLFGSRKKLCSGFLFANRFFPWIILLLPAGRTLLCLPCL